MVTGPVRIHLPKSMTDQTAALLSFLTCSNSDSPNSVTVKALTTLLVPLQSEIHIPLVLLMFSDSQQRHIFFSPTRGEGRGGGS